MNPRSAPTPRTSPRAWTASLALVGGLLCSAAQAGPPKYCRPDRAQDALLAQAQQVFQPEDSAAAEALWDEALGLARGQPACRTVEIAWRIGDALKRYPQVPELALRYLNRGIAAYQKGPPEEDIPLAKVLKTTAQFYKRQGDLEHTCQNLRAAARLFGQFGDQTVEMTQTRLDLAAARCSED